MHLLMRMVMMSVLDVMGARPSRGAAERRTAPDWLRVPTATLLPLTVLQQRHLKQQSRGRNVRYLCVEGLAHILMCRCNITSYHSN